MGVKFGWEHEKEAKFWNTIISSSGIVGLIIGSFTAGHILSLGRRRTIIVMSFVASLGVIPTLYLNLWYIIAGRFIFGLAAGTIIVASSIYLNETVPPEKSSTFDFTTNFGVILGMTTCLLLGLGLPDANKDLIAAKQTEFWRFINVAPLVLCLISLFNWICFFKLESLKYCFIKADYEGAKDNIRKIYRTTNENTVERIFAIQLTNFTNASENMK